jgi:hypothetical protein
MPLREIPLGSKMAITSTLQKHVKMAVQPLLLGLLMVISIFTIKNQNQPIGLLNKLLRLKKTSTLFQSTTNTLQN